MRYMSLVLILLFPLYTVYADLVDEETSPSDNLLVPKKTKVPTPNEEKNKNKDVKESKKSSESVADKTTEKKQREKKQPGSETSTDGKNSTLESANNPDEPPIDPQTQSKTPPSPTKANPRNLEGNQFPVSYSGEGFVGFRKKGTIELIKNVVIEQGDFYLKADRAKVFFDTETDEVKTVIASGNVFIKKLDSKTRSYIKANSETAEFDSKNQVVTLRGQAKLERDDDIIKGAFIKYDLATGWVKAGKVQGIVQPQKEKTRKDQAE